MEQLISSNNQSKAQDNYARTLAIKIYNLSPNGTERICSSYDMLYNGGGVSSDNELIKPRILNSIKREQETLDFQKKEIEQSIHIQSEDQKIKQEERIESLIFLLGEEKLLYGDQELHWEVRGYINQMKMGYNISESGKLQNKEENIPIVR